MIIIMWLMCNMIMWLMWLYRNVYAATNVSFHRNKLISMEENLLFVFNKAGYQTRTSSQQFWLQRIKRKHIWMYDVTDVSLTEIK